MPIPPLVEPVARLSAAEAARTIRQRRLPQLNELGQRRLANARVLVLGAGGLGSPALLYLAAAGVGTIGIVDSDDVEPSNLQRQIAHGTTDVGRPKVASAAESIAALAPEAVVIQHAERLGVDNASDIIGGYDVVIDGTDNFPTRFLVNDTCAALGLPLVWASVLRFDAQLSVFWAYPPAGSGITGVHLRDLFPTPPAEGEVPNCAEAGVLGALCGQVGSLMATEAIKLITGIGEPLIGRILVIDALSGRFTELPLLGTGVPAACPAPTVLTNAPAAPAADWPAVSPIELAARMTARAAGTDDFLVVDVREPDEHAESAVPDARLLPLARLLTEEGQASLPRDLPIVLHCHRGTRADSAAAALRAAGFTDLSVLAGGIVAWNAAVARGLAPGVGSMWPTEAWAWHVTEHTRQHGHTHQHASEQAHEHAADDCAVPASARSVAEQLDAVLAIVTPLPPVRVPLDDARGLVLAEDIRSATDTPPFDNSAMDGYAVRREDLLEASEQSPITLPVIADLAAGTAENPRLAPGQAARIMTGAPIPDGADAVVPIEDTDLGIKTVAIVRPPRPAAHIRRAGEDARAGDTVLQAGAELWPTRIAAAASAGTSTVSAHPAPRVAVISTGSELVTPGDATRRGQIPDSNSYLLAAAVAEAGGVPIRVGAVPDDEDTLRELLSERAGTVDAIVLSGGVSVGAYDVVKAVLARLGTVRFGPVRMQPGKPQGFGRWPGGPVIFALPGNPVSAFVSFEVFVRPALRRMQGHTELHRPLVTAIVADGWDSPPGRAQYMPVTIERQGERTLVRRATAGGSGSHLVAGLGQATGLAIVPEDVTRIGEGDLVSVMLTT